jgi:A/G-specific adenine glycosylase
VLRALRESTGPVTRVALESAGPDPAQVERCIASLIEDGLLEPAGPGRYRLPR